MASADRILIKITDTDKTDLRIEAESRALGSQYDNFAKVLAFQRPKGREEDTLLLLFRDSKTAYEPLDIGKNSEFPVPDGLTRDVGLSMQLAFKNGEELTHSDIVDFTLRPSMPTGSAPAAPWPRPVDELVEGAFVRVERAGSKLRFFSSTGEPVGEAEAGASGALTVSAEKPVNPEEGAVWIDPSAAAPENSQPISALPAGSVVVDESWGYMGKPVRFIVTARNHHAKDEGYPEGAATLMSEKLLAIRAMDAAEPANTVTARRTGGNNNYRLSNLHRWLNSGSPAPWWQASHAYDAAPATGGVSFNPYDTENGFLSNMSESFKALICETSLLSYIPAADNGGAQGTVRTACKVFLPALAETADTNYLDGFTWGYFSGADYAEKRKAYFTAEAVADGKYAGSDRPTAAAPGFWWTRMPDSPMMASSATTYINIDANGGHTSTPPVANSGGTRGVRPCLNLRGDAPVSLGPGPDGAYRILAGSGETAWVQSVRIGGEWVAQAQVPVTVNQYKSYTVTSRFRDRKVVCLGDSITGIAGYPGYLAELLGATVHNCGIGDACMSNTGSYAAFSAHAYAAALASGNFSAQEAAKGVLPASQLLNYQRLRALNLGEIDAFVLAYGVNDWRTNVALGAETSASPSDFTGALREVIRLMSGAFPNAELFLVTPMARYKEASDTAANANGALLKDFVARELEVAKACHVPAHDMWTRGICNQYNYLTYLLADGVHLNDAGCRRYAARVAGLMR